MPGFRVGWGFDVHPLSDQPPVVLGGVTVDTTRGVVATSDGDVVAHAVCDAVLGAAALGDIGMHFPSSDPRWEGSDSLHFVREAVRMAAGAGLAVTFVDVTVVAQTIRIAGHRDAIRASLAEALGIPSGSVAVKATTTDGLGMLGRDEGIAAMAVATVEPAP